tara:strand:+ start:2873 stop:3310 length:438 start_codon:yes stop_codon:yes gene_type:complete
MGKVIEIGITSSKGSEIQKVSQVEAVKGKGLLKDRKFRESNLENCQVTLIEIENINYYNNKSKAKIMPLLFRRNIVTENIRLNELVGKEFFVGGVKLKAHDLCEPCKYLEKKLNQENLVKTLLSKAGVRCEILTSGTISIGDIIK